MNKMHKIMFQSAPASVRKAMHALDRKPNEFHVMGGTVPRPAFVKLADGRVVPYTGP